MSSRYPLIAGTSRGQHLISGWLPGGSAQCLLVGGVAAACAEYEYKCVLALVLFCTQGRYGVREFLVLVPRTVPPTSQTGYRAPPSIGCQWPSKFPLTPAPLSYHRYPYRFLNGARRHAT